jgi:hypothetical protein
MTADLDYRCCARPDGHDGPCEWICSDCNGTGRCPTCDSGDCVCDDVVQCEWCDGNHACPICFDGWIVESL